MDFKTLTGGSYQGVFNFQCTSRNYEFIKSHSVDSVPCNVDSSRWLS